ncbi:MAG: hypothetical protein ABSC03_11910 [Verrucomicrobiota bacterium]|jgi:hypothetical protein
MKTRNGKIARLPLEVREQLNRRLDNGEPGKQLVEWLNARPEVQALLKAGFDGRPISEQNLSEWKQGGYRDWLKQQERREMVRQVTEDADQLDADAGGVEVSSRLSVVLAAELAQTAQELLDETTDRQERWERLQEVLTELASLRREDHKAGRLQLERERWEKKQAKAKAMNEAFRRFSPLRASLTQDFLTDAFNRSDPFSQAAATDMAESMLLSVPVARLGQSRGDPAGSNPIKPNQTE